MRPPLDEIRERCSSLLDGYNCYPDGMPEAALVLVDEDIPALLSYVEELEAAIRAACRECEIDPDEGCPHTGCPLYQWREG